MRVTASAPVAVARRWRRPLSMSPQMLGGEGGVWRPTPPARSCG